MSVNPNDVEIIFLEFCDFIVIFQFTFNFSQYGQLSLYNYNL